MNKNSKACILCPEKRFESSEKLFLHLLIAHSNVHKVCKYCVRYFYTQKQFESHSALHISKKNGYIQCPHCEFSCLSKLTAVEHAAKHCLDSVPKKLLRNKSKLVVVENNFEDGFSVMSISCQYKIKKDGTETYICNYCKTQFNNIVDFTSHSNTKCATKSIEVSEERFDSLTKDTVMPEEPTNEQPEISNDILTSNPEMSRSLSNLTDANLNIPQLSCAGEEEGTEEYLDESLEDLTMTDAELQQLNINADQQTTKPREAAANVNYITVDDNPIAEFLKIPAKNYTSPDKRHRFKRNENVTAIMPMRKAGKPVMKDEDLEKMDHEKEQLYLQEEHTLELYECDFCNHAFSNQRFLQRHRKTHLRYMAENKYYCRFCVQKRFSKVTALLAHVALSHKRSRLYQCSICREDFDKQVYFSTHIKTVHQDGSGKFRFDNQSGYIIYKEKEDSNAGSEMAQESSAVELPEDHSYVEECKDNLLTEEVLVDDSKQSLQENSVHNIIDTANQTLGKENDPASELSDSVSEAACRPFEEVFLKEAVVVLEDVAGKSKTTKAKGKRRMKLHSSKKMKGMRRSLRSKPRSGAHYEDDEEEGEEMVTKKTPSNIVIKVKTVEQINKRTRSKMKYKCHFCSKRFKANWAFHLHIKSHFQEDSFLCTCGVRLSSGESLYEHKRKYHANNASADIVLIKLNEESYKFVQQCNTSTMQGTLRKVHTMSPNPIHISKLTKFEYMGEAILTPLNDDNEPVNLPNTHRGTKGIVIHRVPPEKIDTIAPNPIRMERVGEGIQKLKGPFTVNSTYVSPDTCSNIYNGVTLVTKLLPNVTRPPAEFTLTYNTFAMPTGNSKEQSNVKLITPLKQSASELTLVETNPLAHLMSSQTNSSVSLKTPRKRAKALDYEAIIKKNLANILSSKPKKKK